MSKLYIKKKGYRDTYYFIQDKKEKKKKNTLNRQ